MTLIKKDRRLSSFFAMRVERSLASANKAGFLQVALLLLFSLAATGTANATTDFRKNFQIQDKVNAAEKAYENKQWRKAISIAQQGMKLSAPDSPTRQRFIDLITLAIDGENRQKLHSEKVAKEAAAKKQSEKDIIEGTNRLKEKKYSEAYEFFQKALEKNAKDSETLFLMGFSALKLKRPAAAYEAFKNCIQLNSNHTQALFHLSDLSFKLKRFKEAENYAQRSIVLQYKRLEELKNLSSEQLVGGFNDQAIATSRRISGIRNNLAQIFYLAGILAEKRKDWNAARTAFSNSSKLDPKPLETYFHSGQANFHTQRPHQAQQAFEHAVFMGETLLREKTNTVKKLTDEGKTNEAVTVELEVKALKEKMALARYSLAVCAGQRKDMGTAMDSIDMALKHKPEFLDARLARALFLAGMQDFQSALHETREILKRARPNSPEAKKSIDLLKKLTDRSIESTFGKTFLPQVTKKAEEDIPRPLVKDNPGLGGRKAEAEWAEIFPIFREIEELRLRNDVAQAIRKLVYLQRNHPNFVQIHSTLGQCYYDIGRFDDAIDSFKKALALNADDPESLGNLAYIYSLRGQHMDRAMEMALKAVKIEPNKPEFHHTLGWVYFRSGEVDKAVQHLQRALSLRADYPLARYNLGLATYLSGNFELALKAFDQVIAAQPKHDKAILFKAITLAKLKKTEEAIKTLDDLKKELPKDETLVKVVAKLHDRIKFAHDRNADIPVPNIRHPAPIQKLLREARIKRDKFLVTRAKEIYLECQRLNPDAFEPYYELGAMYAESGLYSPALKTWKQAMKINPNSFDLQLNLGKMFHKLNERETAKEAFNKAEALKPNHPEPSYYLGLIAYESQNFESAESYALQAIRMNQRFFKAQALLGLARIHLGRYAQARDVYETIYLKAPSQSSIKRLAQRKLWELARLMAPNKPPSIPDAMRAKEYLYDKATKPLQNVLEPPKPGSKKRVVKMPSMTTDDKIAVLQRLEGFERIPAPPMPGDKVIKREEDKQWIQRKLEQFRTTKRIAPPPKMTSKYKLHAPPAPEREPDRGDDYVKQGINEALRGLLAEAEASFQKAREVSPKNLDALYNLGFLQTISGNFLNAFDSFTQASLVYPKADLPQMAIGNLFWFGGKGKEAIERWKTISGGIEPDREFNILSRSEKIWKRLAEETPSDIEAHSHLGLIYLFSHKPEKAFVEFETVLKLDPKRIEHKFYQAACHVMNYLKIKDRYEKKKAKELLVGLAALSPPFPHAGALLSFVNSL